jgi:membrane fusion protein (multidrug efflux system)
MFARVNAVFGVRETAMMIPEEAIIPQGPKVFVIKLLPGPSEKSRTTQRIEVKVGLRRPGKVEILEGLEPTDSVVATGQQRVQKDGTVVNLIDLSARGGKPGEGAGPPGAAASAPAATAAVAATPASAPAATKPAAPAAPAGKMAKAPEGPNPCGDGPTAAAGFGGKPGQKPGQQPGAKPGAMPAIKPA